MTFHELYQDYLNCAESVRVQRATDASNRLYQFCLDRGLSSNDAIGFLVSVVKLFVSGDLKTSRVEHDLFNKVFGTKIDYEKFFEMTNKGGYSDYIESMDKLIDGMADTNKVDVCILGLCFLAQDGTVTVKEQELFEKIMG